MKTLLDQVREFHERFGHPVRYRPGFPEDRRLLLRVDLIEEEFGELIEAVDDRDMLGVADALGDLAYVIAGMALELGIPLDKVCDEIHRSNMSKLGQDGRPITRHDGKTMKGPNYTPPDLEGILK